MKPSATKNWRALEEQRGLFRTRRSNMEVASGFRCSHRDVHAWVRLWTSAEPGIRAPCSKPGPDRRQPITRGGNRLNPRRRGLDQYRQDHERECRCVVGYDVPGKPALFSTTKNFWFFNLKSLDELPPMAEIRGIEDLIPQLLAPVAPADDADETPVAPQIEAANEESADAGLGTSSTEDTAHEHPRTLLSLKRASRWPGAGRTIAGCWPMQARVRAGCSKNASRWRDRVNGNVAEIGSSVRAADRVEQGSTANCSSRSTTAPNTHG